MSLGGTVSDMLVGEPVTVEQLYTAATNDFYVGPEVVTPALSVDEPRYDDLDDPAESLIDPDIYSIETETQEIYVDSEALHELLEVYDAEEDNDVDLTRMDPVYGKDCVNPVVAEMSNEELTRYRSPQKTGVVLVELLSAGLAVGGGADYLGYASTGTGVDLVDSTLATVGLLIALGLPVAYNLAQDGVSNVERELYRRTAEEFAEQYGDYEVIVE